MVKQVYSALQNKSGVAPYRGTGGRFLTDLEKYHTTSQGGFIYDWFVNILMFSR